MRRKILKYLIRYASHHVHCTVSASNFSFRNDWPHFNVDEQVVLVFLNIFCVLAVQMKGGGGG